jgi:hypothetical protein
MLCQLFATYFAYSTNCLHSLPELLKRECHRSVFSVGNWIALGYSHGTGKPVPLCNGQQFFTYYCGIVNNFMCAIVPDEAIWYVLLDYMMKFDLREIILLCFTE